jgi:hypothetical protein
MNAEPDAQEGCRVVISQSMYFPWVGMLEQLRLADKFVHYDDVQFSKGSFTNRVQVKTASGLRWLTLPLLGFKLGQRIDQVQLNEDKDWRSQHRETLRQAYLKAPFREDMLRLVDDVFSERTSSLSKIARSSMQALADYFELTPSIQVYDAANMGIPGHGSQRVLDIVETLNGGIYITGHGARNYLDHELFESRGVEVRYMDYQRLPYPQMNGEFTPYVTALDLVANCGKAGVEFIQSEAISWREFLNESE